MTKLKIKVTKDILEKTANCEENESIVKNCAIAVAVRDIFPKASVEETEMYFDNRKMFASANLPNIARRFIRKFDVRSPEQRKKMDPIEFEIEIPDEVIEKINIEEIKTLLVNHPTLELA